MALGILAFGDDRVSRHESAPANTVMSAVANDGLRVYALADGTIQIAERGATPHTLTQLLGPPQGLAIDDDRIFAVIDQEIDELDLTPSLRAAPPGHLSFTRVRMREGEPAVTSFTVSAGRGLVGTSRSLAVYSTLDADPTIVPIATVAVTAKTDGSEFYALDPQGIVHVISAETAKETRALTGGRPGTAIAYALGPNRVFVARADAATLDVYELETGSHDAVPLANPRTGTFSSGASALAVVPRTDFLYALDEGRVVVVETHGTSPYTSIPVGGSMLGVDGEGDTLVVTGPGGADLIETGRHPLAWRLPGVLFAALLAFLLVLLARRLFASAVLPALVGLAVVLDGSMFAQARIGMNDIYVATPIVAGWYFVVAAHRPRRSALLDVLIAGVLFGLALASKWAGAYTLVGVGLASLAVTVDAYERGRPGKGGPLDLLAFRGANTALLFVSFAVIPVGIYLASYVRWFGGPTAPYGWNLVELTQQMYWYHSSLTAPHCAGAPWWSWPLDLKPTYWYFGQSGANANAYIYDAGNLVLFWAALPAAALVSALAYRARSLPLAIVVFAALAQYVAWIPITRVLFFYHFFTVLPFYLLALAAGLAYLWEVGRARWVVAYLATAAAAFAYFYPFISAQPFPGAQAGMFFIRPTRASAKGRRERAA